MPESNPTCETCPYWKSPEPLSSDWGQCHIRSVPGQIGINGWLPWPGRLAADWCGEHPDRPENKPYYSGVPPGTHVAWDLASGPSETMVTHPDGLVETFAEHERRIGNPNFSKNPVMWQALEGTKPCGFAVAHPEGVGMCKLDVGHSGQCSI